MFWVLTKGQRIRCTTPTSLTVPNPTLPWRGHPYKKDGVVHWKRWKESLRGTKILFCGRGLKCFSPLRGTNSKTTHHLCAIIFWLNTLKGTARLHCVNTLRGTKTGFLSPKRQDKHFCPFYVEVSSLGTYPAGIPYQPSRSLIFCTPPDSNTWSLTL